MLWNSQAEAIVAASFASAKWNADRDRRLEAEQRRDILEHDWHDQIRAALAKIYTVQNVYSDMCSLISVEHNVLARIASALSTVYQWGVARELADARQNAIAKLLWEEAEIDETLEQANILTNVLGDVLLVPRVIQGAARADARMTIDILTPDRVTVVQDPEDPTSAIGFWYDRTCSESPTTTKVQRILATRDAWRYYDQRTGALEREELHGLGILPAVVVHDSKRVDTFWNQAAFRPVAEAARSVGVGMCQLRRLQKWQAELQPTFGGAPASDIAVGLEVGAHGVLASKNGQGTWGVLPMQADLSKLITSINSSIAWIGQMYRLEVAGDITSGFQFRLARLPLLEQRARQTKTWRKVEKQLLRLMALVAQRHHPLLKLDPSVPFKKLNFNEDAGIEDAIIQRDVWDRDLKLGITSRAKILMEKDPDLTLDEARALLLENAEDDMAFDEARRSMQVPATGPAVPMTPAEGAALGGQTRARPTDVAGAIQRSDDDEK